MDFMKWLNSLDELLYEVMSWLVFFPLTLWRTLIGPNDMMRYADRQLALPQEEQYADALSPPLFLALSLVLAHGVATALGEADALIANRHGLAGMIDDQTSALVLRLVVFAAFPLVMAVRLVRRQRVPVDRRTLRLPFYAQCYPAAVFALALSLGTNLTSVSLPWARTAGLTLVIAAPVYYVAVETRWFAERLRTGWVRGLGAALLGLLEGTAVLLVIGFLFTR